MFQCPHINKSLYQLIVKISKYYFHNLYQFLLALKLLLQLCRDHHFKRNTLAAAIHQFYCFHCTRQKVRLNETPWLDWLFDNRKKQRFDSKNLATSLSEMHLKQFSLIFQHYGYRRQQPVYNLYKSLAFLWHPSLRILR